MIDFHSHILPNIDDGSSNMEETLNIIKEAKIAGFDGIISTSHYLEGYYVVSKAERTMLLEAIKSKLKQDEFDIDLYLGSEIYITNNIFELLQEEKASSINDTNYVLFELPFNAKPLNLYDVIYDMIGCKLVPISISIYPFVHKDPNIIFELINKGVLMQANYGSFIGQYGNKTKLIAKKLLENNMIHFLGSDVHRFGSIYANMGKCIDKIVSIIGKDRFEILSTVNPKIILQNKEILVSEPNEIKLSFKEKFILNK